MLANLLILPNTLVFRYFSLNCTLRKFGICQKIQQYDVRLLHCVNNQYAQMLKMMSTCNFACRSMSSFEIGEFRIPGRPRTSACFCAKATLMRVTSYQEDKQT